MNLSCLAHMASYGSAFCVTHSLVWTYPLNGRPRDWGCFNSAAMPDRAKLAQESGAFCESSATIGRNGRRNRKKAWFCEFSEKPHPMCESNDEEEAPIGSAEDSCKDPKRQFALRIKGRTRLLLRFLKASSPKLILRECMRHLQKHLRGAAIFSIFAFAIGLGCWCSKLTAMSSPQTVPYSEFIEHLQATTVTNALFEEGSRHIFFNVRSQDQNDEQPFQAVSSDTTTSAPADKTLKKHQAAPWTYSTRKIDNDESYVLAMMRQNGVTYSSAPQSMSIALRNTLLTIVTLWIPLTPLIWIMQRQLSGGRTSGRKVMLNKQSTKFEDVAGVDDAKAELREIVSFLKDGTTFKRIGAKLPKGVLLVGPPGTGKTLLARAVAGEAGVPFFSVSASEFVEMFVGRGAARIRELFAVSRKCAPSIIFIDELDAVGGYRGRSFNDERDQTLNQLLTEMDGFDSEPRVLVIAATNRLEALDPALCRAGRFSRKVFMKEPDFEGRRQILAVHMRNIPVEGDAEVVRNTVASTTHGFVGADLATLVNEAALLAVRQGRSAVTLEDLKEAIDRVKYGVGNRTSFNSILEKELGRWFGWIPSKTSTNQSPDPLLGYISPRLSG